MEIRFDPDRARSGGRIRLSALEEPGIRMAESTRKEARDHRRATGCRRQRAIFPGTDNRANFRTVIYYSVDHSGCAADSATIVGTSDAEWEFHSAASFGTDGKCSGCTRASFHGWFKTGGWSGHPSG